MGDLRKGDHGLEQKQLPGTEKDEKKKVRCESTEIVPRPGTKLDT